MRAHCLVSFVAAVLLVTAAAPGSGGGIDPATARAGDGPSAGTGGSPVAASNQWRVVWPASAEVVDPSAAGDAAMTLDAAGRPHLVYEAPSPSGVDLLHAAWTDEGWSIERVDDVREGGDDSLPAIALAADGRLHVAYAVCAYIDNPFAGGDACHVRHAVRDDGRWTQSWVDPFERWIDGRRLPPRPSLALDDAGQAHIAFENAVAPNRITYARQLGGVWRLEVVDSGAVTRPQLALDRAGQPHVAYRCGDLLCYSRRDDDGTWRVEQHLSPQPLGDYGSRFGERFAFGLDRAGDPLIAFIWHPGFAAGAGQIRVCLRRLTTSEGWYNAAIPGDPRPDPDVPVSPVLAVGPDNAVHLVVASSGHIVRYVSELAGGWQEEPVGAELTAATTYALAVDAAGQPHLAGSGPDRGVQYARAALQAAYTVSGRVADGAGRGLADAVLTTHDQRSAVTDATGRYTVTHVLGGPTTLTPAYYDYHLAPAERRLAVTGDLTGQDFTVMDRWEWHLQRVHPRAETGALATDSAGGVHVALVEGGRMWLGDQSAGRWAFAELPGLEWQIADPRLAAAGPGQVHLVFRECHLFGCTTKHARRREGAWSVEPIGTRMLDLALAVDATDAAHIAYIRGGLWYSRLSAAGGATEEPVATEGTAPAMVVDGAGVPQVAYHDLGLGRLVLAARIGEVWTREVVDASLHAGLQPGLTLDGLQQPALCYVDWRAGRLKLARRLAGQWRIVDVAAAPPDARCQLAVDGRDAAHVAFETGAGATYLRQAPEGWRAEPLPFGPALPALATDPSGRVHVLQPIGAGTLAAWPGIGLAWGEATTAFSVSGYVTDAAGAPVTGLAMTVRGAGVSRTDASGRYTFTLRAPGPYTIAPLDPAAGLLPPEHGARVPPSAYGLDFRRRATLFLPQSLVRRR